MTSAARQPPDHAERLRAADPERSVIVQAPAGSGKTTLLVNRYLGLLARADQPEEVLAITFTRKAAGEMRARVVQALAVGGEIARGALARSKQLGWNLTQQPNRLKIQTIDSFAMALLRQMPLTASFNPRAELIEEAGELYLEAADRLLGRLYNDDPLAEYLADFLAWLGNDQQRAARLLATMLGRRDQWLDVVSQVVRTHQQSPDQVPSVLGAGIDVLNDRLIAAVATELGPSCYAELHAVIDQAAAHLGLDIEDPRERYCFVSRALTTQSDRLRKSLTKNQGFPTTDRELKQRGISLLEALADGGHEPLLANLKYLPAPVAEGELLDTLIGLCVTLTLAVVDLNEIFAARKVADFTQLILGARTVLNDADAPTELALALDYRIRHLLVDEFQDTSVSQFRMFEQLVQGWSLNDANTFFAVGDPMQSIYRFRDAEVSLFFDAWNHGIGDVDLERVRLSANFRAQAGLVDWFNSAFPSVLGRTQDPLLGRVAYSPALAVRGPAPEPAVTVGLFRHNDREIQAVIALVTHLLESDDASRVAILVRSRPNLKHLLPALREAAIPWRATDIEPLVERPVVQDLLALARALADPHDRLAWFSVLRAPWVGLALVDLEVFANCDTIANMIAAPPTALSADGRHRIDRLANALAAGARLLDEAPPRRALETVWIAAGGVDAYPDPLELDSAERLLELVDSLGVQGLHPRRLETAASSLYAAAGGEDARLEILTIHKAKGLEFDHVILPFLDRVPRSSDAPLLRWRPQTPGLLMAARDSGSLHDWLAREDRARDRHELERLVYVACTRARQGLHLFATEHDRTPSGSLLAMLGPALEGLPGAIAATAAPDPATPFQNDLFAARQHKRLLSDYEWRAPSRRALEMESQPAPESKIDDGLDRHWQVALGTLMHEALFTLSQTPLPEHAEAFIAARRDHWRTQLTNQQVDPNEHDATVAELERQIRLVLADATGRWLLSARQGAASETPLTGIDDSGLANVFLDRTLVDDDGVRWIIDYKSVVTEPGGGDALVTRETARYLPQLRRYAGFAAAAYPEPLRVAIYFTALPRLEVLEPTG